MDKSSTHDESSTSNNNISSFLKWEETDIELYKNSQIDEIKEEEREGLSEEMGSEWCGESE